MAYPDYYPGDLVLIGSRHKEDEVSRVLEGKIGEILYGMGPIQRARGSTVGCAYYRVFIPELGEERTVKGHYLTLIERGHTEEEGRRLWRGNLKYFKDKLKKVKKVEELEDLEELKQARYLLRGLGLSGEEIREIIYGNPDIAKDLGI